MGDWARGAEAYAADFLGADLHVAQDVARNDDLAALLVREAKFGALGHGLGHDLGNSIGIQRGFEHDLTANILNADLYFHSKASKPIKG